MVTTGSGSLARHSCMCLQRGCNLVAHSQADIDGRVVFGEPVRKVTCFGGLHEILPDKSGPIDVRLAN
jgi:hypothetical protein